MQVISRAGEDVRLSPWALRTGWVFLYGSERVCCGILGALALFCVVGLVCFFVFAIFVYIRAFFVCVIGVEAVFVFKKNICFLLYVQGLSNICSD